MTYSKCHPMNQTGVGGTIETMAYHPINQTGVGGTIETIPLIHFENPLI